MESDWGCATRDELELLGAGFGTLRLAENFQCAETVVVADDVWHPVGLVSACFDAVAGRGVGYGRLEGRGERGRVRCPEEHETDDCRKVETNSKWQHCDCLATLLDSVEVRSETSK